MDYVQRYVFPIIENGEILGSISIVTTIQQYKRKDGEQTLSLEKRVRLFEKQEIERLLLIYGKNLEGKKKAAKELGISLATLYNKLNEK